MNLRLFEYVVIWHPKGDKDKDQDSKILFGPKYELATDAESLKLKLIRMIPKEYEDQLKQIELGVRDF